MRTITSLELLCYQNNAKHITSTRQIAEESQSSQDSDSIPDSWKIRGQLDSSSSFSHYYNTSFWFLMDGPSQINPQKADCTFKSSKHNPYDRKMNQVNNIPHLERPKGIKRPKDTSQISSKHNHFDRKMNQVNKTTSLINNNKKKTKEPITFSNIPFWTKQQMKNPWNRNTKIKELGY